MTLFNSSSLRQWRRSIAKLAVPVGGLMLLALVFRITVSGNIASNSSLLIRMLYTMLFSVGMEYVSRYQHRYGWHSHALWYFHASHHHQIAQFGQGPTASEKQLKANKIDTSSFEWNDIFPVFFASVSIVIYYWCGGEPTLFKDCLVGTCNGISLYGFIYFVGHDLCAHQRGGATLAEFLRRLSPTLAHCADIHSKYHHSITPDAGPHDDPYGPPFGFWLGPQEVKEYYERGNEDMLCMPDWLQFAFRVSYIFMLYAMVDHMKLVSMVLSFVQGL